MKQDNILSEMVKRCALNDRDAHKFIYTQFSKYVYNLTMRYAKNGDDAKDATQETFIQAFASIKSFDNNKGSFKSWLSKIAINKVLKQLKRQDGYSISFEPEIHDISYAHNDLESTHSIDDIMKHLEKMPQNHKMVFELFVIEGFSHEEISDILNISIENSRVQLSRARNWLGKTWPPQNHQIIRSS